MHKTATRFALGALALAALTGTAAAQTVPNLLAPVTSGVSYSAYAAGDVARGGTGLLLGGPNLTAPVVVRDGSRDLDGTLHLFGPRMDGRPY